MMDVLLKIQESGFSQWVRESESLFAFAGILLVHTIGMGFVVGVNATMDLRILGFAPAVRLSALQKFFPVLWLGFWMNAITGTILLGADAVNKMRNPDFYVKMVFIALAIVNLRMLKKQVFQDPLIDKVPPSARAKLLAVTSLLFWLGAITSGRLARLCWSRKRSEIGGPMNSVHIHLLLNHFPTIGFCIGLALFVIALLRRNHELQQAGMVIFFVTAALTIATYVSGNDAQEAIKRIGRLSGSSGESARKRGAGRIRVHAGHRLFRVARLMDGAAAVPDRELESGNRSAPRARHVWSDGPRSRSGRRNPAYGDSERPGDPSGRG